jgi:hypothetical protein
MTGPDARSSPPVVGAGANLRTPAPMHPMLEVVATPLATSASTISALTTVAVRRQRMPAALVVVLVLFAVAALAAGAWWLYTHAHRGSLAVGS